jgi:hypothetical protein
MSTTKKGVHRYATCQGSCRIHLALGKENNLSPIRLWYCRPSALSTSRLSPTLIVAHSTALDWHNLCLTPGADCKAHSRKLQQIDKYPWMEGVTFQSFPHKVHQKPLRKKWIDSCRRQNKEWEPSVYSRVCSRNFEGELPKNGDESSHHKTYSVSIQ